MDLAVLLPDLIHVHKRRHYEEKHHKIGHPIDHTSMLINETGYLFQPSQKGESPQNPDNSQDTQESEVFKE